MFSISFRSVGDELLVPKPLEIANASAFAVVYATLTGVFGATVLRD